MNNVEQKAMLPIGTLLQGGKYRIVRHLASGGFGNTYVATNTEFDELVAIKEFFMRGVSERSGDTVTVSVTNAANMEHFTGQKDKFRKEARRLRKLRNDHIVTVHDLFEENGTTYYEMDLINGESLNDRLKRTGQPFSEAEVMHILDQVLDALAFVHNQGLYHLDLKPANIMMEKTGRVLLVDFGASKQMLPTGGMSVSSGMVYTPGFAPLEQTEQNTKCFGPWTDLYSLGATLYKLLTNRTPPTASEVLVSRDALQYPVPVSDRMKQLISWLMKPRFDERPQNVAAVRRFLTGKGEEEETKPFILQQPVSDATQPAFSQPTPSQISHPSQSHPSQMSQRSQMSHPSQMSQRSQMGHPSQMSQRSQMSQHSRLSRPVQQPKKKNYTWVVLVVSFFGLLIGCGIVGAAIFLLKKGGGETEDGLLVTRDNTPVDSVKTYNVKGIDFKMLRVTGGEFSMGATGEQEDSPIDHERPIHRVTLSTYSIGETEVTQELWQAVMGSNPSENKGPKLPVENVTWDDCQTFIKKLNELTDQTFRLPTEAEWEFAARGGADGNSYKYAGNNTLGTVAWYDSNSNNTSHDVATKEPNDLGLYDMSGNVSEWCHDKYGRYTAESVTDPQGAPSGSYHVYRGGSYDDGSSMCRVSCRSFMVSHEHIGLRLAK